VHVNLIVYGSLNKHGETVFKPFTMKICEVIWIFRIIFERQGPEKGMVFFAEFRNYKEFSFGDSRRTLLGCRLIIVYQWNAYLLAFPNNAERNIERE
jgi:hypothetical protein